MIDEQKQRMKTDTLIFRVIQSPYSAYTSSLSAWLLCSWNLRTALICTSECPHVRMAGWARAEARPGHITLCGSHPTGPCVFSDPVVLTYRLHARSYEGGFRLLQFFCGRGKDLWSKVFFFFFFFHFSFTLLIFPPAYLLILLLSSSCFCFIFLFLSSFKMTTN